MRRQLLAAVAVKVGLILVFLPALGQFVVPDLLGGAKTILLGNLLQQQFGPSRDWPFGAAITTVFLAFVALTLWIGGDLRKLNLLGDREKKDTR